MHVLAGARSSNRWARAHSLALPWVASAGAVCGDQGVDGSGSTLSTAQHGPGNCMRSARVLGASVSFVLTELACVPLCRPAAFVVAVVAQALIAAHEVMEVRRTLYFAENLGNRNIGGGMRVGAVCAAWEAQLRILALVASTLQCLS